MKSSRFERASAAMAAMAVTLSIVWAISGYAYPEVPAAWLGELAKAMASLRPRA